MSTIEIAYLHLFSDSFAADRMFSFERRQMLSPFQTQLCLLPVLISISKLFLFHIFNTYSLILTFIDITICKIKIAHIKVTRAKHKVRV